MELKRYVLLENKEIIDTSKEIYYFRGEDVLYRDRPSAVMVTVCMGKAIKTSDNILDLVEVGDLVEDNCNNILKVELVTIEKNGEHQFYCIFDTWEYDEITSIYKRQPNGDYKRYLV